MGTLRVLFVCTHNSARSQMAEGFLREYGGDRFEVFSAGTEATAVRPEAIKAMAEVGIDISGHESKTVDRYLGQSFAWVITVCDQAREACPIFPGAMETAHWGFDDPSARPATRMHGWRCSAACAMRSPGACACSRSRQAGRTHPSRSPPS